MADPFSIASGAVGIVSLGITVAQGLVNYCVAFKDCPDEVAATVDSLKSLTEVLKQVKSFLESDRLSSASRASVEKNVNSCETFIRKLQDELDQFQTTTSEHSLRKKLSTYRDRAVYPFKESTLTKLKQTLSGLHDNLNTAIQVANLDATYLISDRVANISATQATDTRNELTSWLIHSSTAQHAADIESRSLSDKGSWFTTSKEYRLWNQGNEQNVLLCQGHPGNGKTFITVQALKHLNSTPDGSAGIASFFCTYKPTEEQSVRAVLSNILGQFLKSLRKVPASILQLYTKHDQGRTKASPAELESAINETGRNFSRVYIIIDALDEFERKDEAHHELLDRLLRIQQTLKAKLMATSRFVDDITNRFEDALLCQIRGSDSEINGYLEERLKNHSMSSVIRNNLALQDEIKVAITTKADGMFLLAVLYVQCLTDKTSPRKVRQTLESLSTGVKGLQQLYDEARARIDRLGHDRKDLARKTIAWITFAKRPLSMVELQHALAVELEDDVFDESNISPPDTILTTCLGLVVEGNKDQSIVRFCHYTTQEYFEKALDDWFPEAKLMIAQHCFAYLFLQKDSPAYDGGLTGEHHRLHKPRFFDYAARYASNHAKQLPPHQEVQLTSKFFKCPTSVDCAFRAVTRPDPESGPMAAASHFAAFHGLVESMKVLISTGASVEVKDSQGKTPLAWAAMMGELQMVKLLSTSDQVDMNSKGKFGFSPLHLAAYNGNTEIVRFLLQQSKIDVNIQDESGRVALHQAVKHAGLVKELLAHPEIKADKVGCIPNSIRKGSVSGTPLIAAAQRGVKDVVELLGARADVDVNMKCSQGRTALCHAIISPKQSERLAVVDCLILCSSKLDTADEEGMTPLMYAAKLQQLSIVELLLSRPDMTLESVDKHGRNALWHAVHHDYYYDGIRDDDDDTRLLVDRIATLLVNAGIDSNRPDGTGLTPLILASERGLLDLVQLFMSVDHATKDNRGVLPFQIAAARGHDELVRYFLDNGYRADDLTQAKIDPRLLYMGRAKNASRRFVHIARVYEESGVWEDSEVTEDP